MFGKKEKTIKSEKIDSLIGENIKIIGDIEGSGSLRIDGVVEGNIQYKGCVNIGESGKVDGNISCGNIDLAGIVNGNIISQEKLTILPSGKLIGHIEVMSFIVHESATFEGNCKMIKERDNVKKLDTKQLKKNKKGSN